MARFTWTYGGSDRRTIFIEDATLPDPKRNGIAAILCNQIGNKEAERLATLLCRALSMLALLERALPLIEDEAGRRSAAMTFYGNFAETDAYWTEMQVLADVIKAEIAKAKGESEKEGEVEND
jgi:hypothetical protein